MQSESCSRNGTSHATRQPGVSVAWLGTRLTARYNRDILRRLFLLLCLLAAVSPARLQAGTTPPTQLLVVMPFDNLSKAPGLDWIGESFPEILGERLGSGNLFVVSRADRLYAFDRLGIPTSVHPSRATVLRIAEAMDADYVVLGSYNFDGQSFTASAQLLDMRRLHLSPEMKESGPLVKLLDIENALAWDLLRSLNPALTLSRNEYVAASPPVRLDALEAYMRGVIASNDQERIPHFRRAVRLNPDYTRALLELGKTYFNTKDYASAADYLARIARSDPLGREAGFYLGLACYYAGQFPRAEEAFSFVASAIPLTEVYNNLGVVASRRQNPAQARQYFERALQADPNNPDYHFNLAVTLARTGDTAGAARESRAALALHPDDGEAQSLLEAATKAGAVPLSAAKLPLERIQLSYDETSYRQLAMEIANVSELRLAQLDDRSHARAHVERGRQMLEQGYLPEAEKQFREAVTLDPTSAAAHAGLAQALEKRDFAAARAEAQAALRLEPSVEAYLVLARLDLRDNKVEDAARSVEQALALAPADAAALALQRDIAAKRAQKAPPLHNP